MAKLGARAAGMQAAAAGRRAARQDVQMRWFDRQVARNIRIGMTTRLKIAAQMLRDRVVVNISRPVGRDGLVVTVRSQPGEFPRLETGRLQKDIFWELDGKLSAVVGTTLDYGLVLETQMNRSFLRRTFRQMQPSIRRILTRGQPSDFPGNRF